MRLTISVPDSIAQAAAANASAQKRSTSAYVAMLIEADLRAAGLLDPVAADADLIAQIREALADNPSLRRDIDALLRAARRRTRAA